MKTDMTLKEAITILITSVQNNSSCGRLSTKEQAAIKVLREYIKSINEGGG